MAVTTQRIGSRVYIKSRDHDPGATSATLASPDGGTTPWYLDMSLFGSGAIMYKPTIVAAGGVTLVRVFASTDIAGATDATLLKTSGTIAGDSLNDTVFLEWTADEISQLADAAGVSSLRYITVEITHATNTDEGCLTFFGFDPRYPRDGLTATEIT